MHTDSTARDVMRHEFVGVSESDTLADAASLAVEETANCIVVMRGHEPIGQVSIHELLDATLESGSADRPVNEIMDATVPTVPDDAGLSAVRKQLVTDDVASVLVVNGEGPIGVVTERDLLLAVGDPDTAVSDDRVDRMSDPSYETEGDTEPQHSICELCGSLSAELTQINGQMRCPNCADV